MNLLPLPQADSAYFLPYQLRWLDDDSPLKIVERSRQIGLTYMDAYDSLIKASSRKAADVYVSSRDLVTTGVPIRSGFIRGREPTHLEGRVIRVFPRIRVNKCPLKFVISRVG